MSRSSSWRSARRSASRSGSRHGLDRTASTRVSPDPDGQLSGGVLIEAQIRGRLLGAPILRLDAVVVLTPARPEVVAVMAPPARPRPAPAVGVPAAARAAPGSSLAAAQSLVDENALSLRQLGPA